MENDKDGFSFSTDVVQYYSPRTVVRLIQNNQVMGNEGRVRYCMFQRALIGDLFIKAAHHFSLFSTPWPTVQRSLSVLSVSIYHYEVRENNDVICCTLPGTPAYEVQ